MLPSMQFRIYAYMVTYCYFLLKYIDVIDKGNSIKSLPRLVYDVYYHNFFIANIPIIIVSLFHGNYLGLILSYFYIANFDIINRIVGITTDNKSKKNLCIEEHISLLNVVIIIIVSISVSLIIQGTMNEMMFYWDMFSFFYQVIYWSSPVKEIFILLGIYTQLFFIKLSVGFCDWVFILIEWIISPIQDFRDIAIDKECGRFTLVMLPWFSRIFPLLYICTNFAYFFCVKFAFALIINSVGLYTIHLLNSGDHGKAYNLHNLRYLFIFVLFFY